MNNSNHNGSFFAVADKVGTFLFANFIWVVMSMTLVGIPFATLGLFAMMNDWVRGRQPEFFRVFGGTIREKWRQALVIGLIDLIIGGLLIINFSIFRMMEINNLVAAMSHTMTVSVAVIFIAANLYLWSLVSLVELPLKQMLKLTLILVLTYPVKTLGMLILAIIPVVVSLFVPIAFFLFVTASTVAYVGARGTRQVLSVYSPEFERL